MTTFKINDELEVRATTQNVNTGEGGFKHIATLYRNGQKVTSASQRWYNRTWESWTFQTAMRNLHRRLVKQMAVEDASAVADFIDTYKEPNPFGFVAAVAQLGTIFGKDEKEANAWKQKMISAVSGIDIPDNFDSLDESERTRRLDAVISEMKKETQ